MGFLPDSYLFDDRKSLPLVARCEDCGLYKTCESPKMAVYGEGQSGILVVAEAPGETEDKQGRPLVGKAGKTLRASLSKFRIDLDTDCWATNANICRPPNNETPTDDQIDACRPNLMQAIRELNPKVVILLGECAVKSLIGHLWKEDFGYMGRWVGWTIPCHDNYWIVPTWHPSYINRTENDPNAAVIRLWFDKHLQSAAELTERPWKIIPDYKNKVRVILDPSQAAAEVRKMIVPGIPVAWDLETSSLKPDGAHNFIFSCAVSNGDISVSYPWAGDAIQATKELLVSDTPKYGFHQKFEDRWIKAKLGVNVNNWVWDGMIGAHVLDGRKGICSLKFQSFIRLGQPDYDSRIKPFLKADGGGYQNNRIREADINDILLYGGLDAILEYHVAESQMKEAGVR